eukprot:8262888-Alexandrium_andersonii.AAC.1
MPGHVRPGTALSVHERHCAGSKGSGRSDPGPPGECYRASHAGSGPGCTRRGRCGGARVGR